MLDLIVFLALIAFVGLAVVGAIQVWRWLVGATEEQQRDLANRERQAGLEIQNIAHQAQVAILEEAILRAQKRRPGQSQPLDAIDGQIAASPEDDGTATR